MIKLIASDMDGTLLDSRMQIPEENVAAIKEAIDLGIEFVVATGRNRQEALPSLEQAGIKCAMINLNGAEVFDADGKSLFTVPIEEQKAIAIFDLLDENEIYYEVSTNHGLYSQSQAQRIEHFADMIGDMMPHLTRKMAIAMTSARMEFLPVTYTDNIRETLTTTDLQVLKIICFHREGAKVLGPVAKTLDGFGDVVVTSSGHGNIEINHKNAQKGIAVAHVAKERGIDLKDVMTIGDNLNDVSMIQMAGVSFAMGNGATELKEYAKYITDTNLEAGVGKAIRRAIKENL